MTDSDSPMFSLKGFALALVTIAVGAAGGMALVPVVGTYLGTLAGAFVVGLAVERKPLVEAGVAGTFSALGVLFVSKVVGNGIIDAIIGLITVDPGTLAMTGALSFGVAALGAHLGNDMRDGLTEPVEERPHPGDP